MVALILANPLTGEQVESMMGSMRGVEAMPETFLYRLQEETDGNPFFVELVMRTLVEEGKVRSVDGRWIGRAHG